MSEDHFLNLQPGTIVNGRYEVVKCLGTGSMGLVYACRHRELGGHLVAMKVLFAEVARDEVAAARFRNEIVASYGVSHPNVVRAYEYFRDGDLVAFTMEYVGGGDLADEIGLEQELDIDDIIRLLKQMCAGVQAIHEAGIIHRDLKPENILLTEERDIKITDFGIARTGTGPKLTEHGGVVGTIDYVSPEYLERGQVDARSDIYALGVLAYEMITGDSPFKGNSVIETMTMRLKTDPELPHNLRADCPVELSEIIMTAMRRDPEERYQTAKEVYDELAKFDVVARVSSGKSEKTVVNDEKTFEETIEKQEGHESELEDKFESQVQIADEPTRPTVQISRSLPVPAVEEPEDQLSHEEDQVDEFESERVVNPAASISVSNAHLSSQRMQELSRDFYPEGESLFKTFIVGFLIVIFGLCLGLFFVTKLDPSILESDRSVGLEGYYLKK